MVYNFFYISVLIGFCIVIYMSWLLLLQALALPHPNSIPPSAGKKKTANTATCEYGGLALGLARKLSPPFSSWPPTSDPDVLSPLRSGEVSIT